MSVAFRFTKSQQKVCLERIYQPEPKERLKFIIMKILRTRVKIVFKQELVGLRLRICLLKVTKHQHKVYKFHYMNP